MIRMKRALLVLATVGLASVAAADMDRLAIVQRLMSAFNAHDAEAMSRHVTDDVEWLALDGDSVSVEARGKQTLIEGMRSYFEALPSVRSTIEGSFVSGDYVTVRERARWEVDGVAKSQSSLTVYQVRSGLIHRVWYFPVEP